MKLSWRRHKVAQPDKAALSVDSAGSADVKRTADQAAMSAESAEDAPPAPAEPRHRVMRRPVGDGLRLALRPRPAVQTTAVHATVLHGELPASAPVGQVVEDGVLAVAEDAAPAVATQPAVAGAPSRPRRSVGKWVAWFMAMSAVGAALGLVIAMALKFVDGPVEAHPANSVAKMVATPSATPDVNELSGVSMSFQYPGVFDQVSQLKNDAHSVEQYNISSRSSYQRLIAASVRDLPSNNLDDDSNYRYRRLNPQDYALQNDTLRGEKVAVMSKTDKTEVTLFWAHHGQILSVAITSTNPKDDIVGYMGVIKSSARWKQ